MLAFASPFPELRPAGLLPSLSRAFDTPLRTVGFLLPPGVCFRALRRLPSRDFHPLEHYVFQDAPWRKSIAQRDRPTGHVPVSRTILPKNITVTADSTALRKDATNLEGRRVPGPGHLCRIQK